MTQLPGPIALVGSGEYLPVMRELEGSLLEGRAPRYVQIATAAVPDGLETLHYWHELGATQAGALGVEQVIATCATRKEANDPDVVALIQGAGLIYLSGGHPDFLAETLRGTAVWEAIVAEWKNGAALAGCSAGAMAMTSWIPSIRHPHRGGTEGLALLPHLRVIPHFDAFARRVPDLVTRYLQGKDPLVTLVGIDEETALVGGPTTWTVHGRQAVWQLGHEERVEHRAGSTLSLNH